MAFNTIESNYYYDYRFSIKTRGQILNNRRERAYCKTVYPVTDNGDPFMTIHRILKYKVMNKKKLGCEKL